MADNEDETDDNEDDNGNGDGGRAVQYQALPHLFAHSR